jgi:hypothetical protein
MPTQSEVMTPEEFLARAKDRDVLVVVRGAILTLSKLFTPGSKEGYTAAETDVSLIYEAPGKGGSIWGSDGGSMGGAIGLQQGRMHLNKSGVPKRWLDKLVKAIPTHVTMG